MSKLSPAEIAQHAYDAGFRGDALTTAVAVALAESGGDPRAHNATPPDNSYAESAKQVFDDAGGSWRPWSTYTNGAYKQYLDDARRAVRKVDEDGGQNDGRRHGGGNGPRRDTAASLLGDGKCGYRVDPEALEAYARRGHRASDELRVLAKHEITDLRQAANGFGTVGVESGFADALQEFSGALKHQVRALSNRTDALATATHRVSKAYQEREGEAQRDVKGIAR